MRLEIIEMHSEKKKKQMKRKYVLVSSNLHQNHFYLHCKCYKQNYNAFIARFHLFAYHLVHQGYRNTQGKRVYCL